MSFDLNADEDFARGARAVIAYPQLGGPGRDDPDARLEEATRLAQAIGIVPAAQKAFSVRAPRPATLFGGGQVDEIKLNIEETDASLLIVDGALSPVQQRNLEERLGVKVIDRTGLILEIFGERARTAEGRLQVELAHLDYQAGRLVRSWTHLERQRGGYGFLGGPGETQIEADRRMIRDRMAKLRRRLEDVRRTRGLHRERRQRAPWPLISLVGYTNAGKSTLFNRLTGADVMAEDMLFATLDPTMREISLPGIDKAILSDTVGFVSDLPTQLVAAFRATLEEIVAADLILHVRDIAHPESLQQRQDVLEVLGSMDIAIEGSSGEENLPEDAQAPRIIEVWNKIDLLDEETRSEVELQAGQEGAVTISAADGAGFDQLQQRVAAELTRDDVIHRFRIDPAHGEAIAWLHEHGNVLSEELSEDNSRIEIMARISSRNLGRFEEYFD